MIQNILRGLGGIDGYGITSLCLFTAIAAGVVVWTCAQKRQHLDRMARVPLETDSEDLQKGEDSYE